MDGNVSAGGSRVLAELIDKHGEAILSDFEHYYPNVDLLDLFAEESPLSPRYVLSLIIWLPTDTALAASRRGGPQFRGWDEDRYALVTLVNEMRAGNHLTLLVNRDPKKGSKPKPPEPFPTPDSKTKTPAPKPGSFAAMVVAAKKAAARRR